MSEDVSVKDGNGKGNGAQQSGSAALPLFYKNPKAITQDLYAGKSLKKDRNFVFAAETNSIPLAASEFAHAARCYPIVFASAAPG
ncbi:MAG: SapC family protein, partial [Kiloniellales bacterium]|nr:SapC family protein [Kiloniellales bacterium]